MNTTSDNTISPTDNHSPSGERKQSPPAFLDLADSAARLGTNMPDMSARVELKRMEHERQRLLQRKLFEDQMRALEQQQAQELLSIPYESGVQQFAASAPTTPPRLNAVLGGGAETPSALRSSFIGTNVYTVDPDKLSEAVDTVVATGSDKRKSVTYAPSVTHSPELTQHSGLGAGLNSFARTAGAKSMPASRRTSASSHDEELAAHLENLALVGEKQQSGSPIPPGVASKRNSRIGDEDALRYGTSFNVMMFDQALDQEMQTAMRNLPTSDDDKYANNSYLKKTSSAALDLANVSQASSRSSISARGEKASEWPSFPAGARRIDALGSRMEPRRNVTNPTLGIVTGLNDVTNGNLAGTVSASGTPQIPQLSRRGSPIGVLDALTRSVPATPLGLNGGPSPTHLLNVPGTPGEVSALSRGLGSADGPLSNLEIQSSLSRLPTGQFESAQITYSSSTSNLDETLQQYGAEPTYETDGVRGSTALYHHNGTRYGLGLPAKQNGVDKLNGAGVGKNKRGDMDLNRFAGTRLEDLQGDIPALCKDQHGCRYLQKKLEEVVPEHRDMIFRETFSHFADLMTDPFGNYLCQKLLEFSTDDQRNLICESVAQDLVNISLNMHGTRAVQKMIDFLSTRRQITSIILALSLHVVVLIKDLNGNHVIQKCLNKLAPEDNQFIYNAVAANCVEVATHRHGCCVLQRCIDHASDHQRIQLVNEITYNALTLVQDPYGNYVVQYVLDLNDSRFSDAVIRQFTGNVCALSVQKFSSNVIEKCIRVAEHHTRKLLIDELLNRSRLEKLLRDSYGNYCVQTALDYAEPSQRALLVDGIRPVLPLIRNTPYGKRIQNKLQREQNDQFSTTAGYHGQAALLNSYGGQQGLGGVQGNGRHASQNLHHSNPLLDVYGGAGVYGLQGSYNGSHIGPQLHGLQTQSIDPYVLQGNSSHHRLSPSHSPSSHGYSAGSNFSGVNPYNAGLTTAAVGNPYQRNSFGAYGM